ncbi:integral membrane protein [Histoplasma ohiense]|nr:integral membrane protein [Histoplasma ohiense (nom. inval.)]
MPFLCKYGALIIFILTDPIPMAAAWDFSSPLYRLTYDYQCIGHLAFTFVPSIENVLLDLPTMLVPQFQLPIHQLLAVIAMLVFLGVIVVVAGAVDIKYDVSASRDT